MAQGLSQEALAIKIGSCTGVQIGHLERGRTGLTIYWMRLIAQGLGVYPSDLLVDADRRPSEKAAGKVDHGLLQEILMVALEYRDNISRAENRKIMPSSISEVCTTLYNELADNPPPKPEIEKSAGLLLKFAARR